MYLALYIYFLPRFIGSYKFRSLADELLSLVETKKGDGYATLLKGLRYALCGLGT